MLSSATAATWTIAAAAILGVVVRPWKLPEFYWAVAGAAALVVLGLTPASQALRATAKGYDVYFFLVGMMLLAEVARREGLFDWLAIHAVRASAGSSKRLFAITYVVGVLVTTFLSNDATAVVLTPAVYTAARTAKVDPLPYLLVCAFVANAASFVLPISNPANLVVFAGRPPALGEWLRLFALPSIVSIIVTSVQLRFIQRKSLYEEVRPVTAATSLSRGGAIAALGITATAASLLVVSTLGIDLGLPTLLCGLMCTALISVATRRSPLPLLRRVSWSVIPLVASLFVLVEAVEATGAFSGLTDSLKAASASAPRAAALSAGALVALASNVINNLPMGLIAASTASTAQVPTSISGAVLIGVDLGPNLSITGSLATILWLIALRREGLEISALRFLEIGAVVMPSALLLALVSFVIQSS